MKGSVDLLADAMRKVFTESAQQVQDSMREELSELRSEFRTELGNLGNELKKDIETNSEITISNMQAQFAQQEKKIGKLLKAKQPNP